MNPQKMRLAAVYNVFDGEELLEGSIRQIRPLVDVVIVVYQLTSNWGEEYHKLYITLRELETAGLVDHFELYQPAPVTSGHYKAARLEMAKRNKGISIARDYGCSHFLLIDCDEYYVPAEFQHAKSWIEFHAEDESIVNFNRQTFCRMDTYLKYPTWKIEPPETYLVPFIQPLNKDLDRWVGCDPEKVQADPTRIPIDLRPYMTFSREMLTMHHFSWVRRDISLKLRNSSANDVLAFRKNRDSMVIEFNNFTNEPGQPIPHFRTSTILEVPNQFNIITPFKKI